MRHRGYTLIEVLIVVTIIGLASAVVVPQMIQASSLGIQAAARTLIADLLYAQNEAIAHQEARRVVIDTTNERYWLERPVGTGWEKVELNWRVSGGDHLVDFMTDGRFRGITIATAAVNADGSVAGFTEDGGTMTFEFDELGAPKQGGVVGLRAEGVDFAITVAEFTGRVTVRQIN